MIKRATCKTWAEYFEKREGVRISGVTILDRLKEAGRIGESARNRVGRLLKGAYFSEVDVRQACADLLRPLPQADENGFFEMGGIKHGTIVSWSRALGISGNAIVARLRSASIQFVEGKDKLGHVWDFYPEPAVRQTCADLLRPLPQADETGFFVQDGVCHGTIFAFLRKLGLSKNTISSRLRSASVKSVRGKDSGGNVCDFYPEPAVREVCADNLQPMPQADRFGFFVRDTIRHGTIAAWFRTLGLAQGTVTTRLRSALIQTVKGKDKNGHVLDFYPEPAVNQACADLLRPMPQVGETGFFVLGKVRHGSIRFWSDELRISHRVISSCLRSALVQPVEGKGKGGQIQDFYPEPAVRETCVDLLAKKKK